MAYKYREAYKHNLQEIRNELGYTQKEMGDVLGVTGRMISYYETNYKDFPLDRAFILAREYNYSLDYIYAMEPPTNEHTITNGEKLDEQYIVDIRDFISRSNDEIHITIPEYYWTYIRERNSLQSSRNSKDEKKRAIAKLEANYTPNNANGLYRRFSISITEFLSYLKFDKKFIPYSDFDSDDKTSKKIVPTEEEKAEVMNFLDSLLSQ